MAEACLFVLNLDQETYARETEPMLSHINIGSGTDVTIRKLAETIANVTGFKGRLVFDDSQPDGTPRKLMDVSRLSRLGWNATIELEAGIESTYAWFLEQGEDSLRMV
jgi:GDP-L-fucose synthase